MCLCRRLTEQKNFKATGKQIEASQVEHMSKQLALFKENLESFAAKHKHEINANPVFRSQFTKLCSQVGVDPLASNKGFWSSILGVGDFYYELAVQMIDICLSTRQQNGGLIAIDDLMNRLKEKRGKQSQEISRDDITFAMKSVSGLGNGFHLLSVGMQTLVVSVPTELNTDHVAIMELANSPASGGCVSVQSITKALGWPRTRIDTVLNLMMQEGMAWIDTPIGTPYDHSNYWFPSLYKPPAAAAGSGSGSAGSAAAPASK